MRRRNRFFVDENCDGCGVCVDVCPVGNVGLKDEKPVWGNKCESCLACFHWCPKASIQASEKTKVRGRYHQPGVEVEEIMRK